MKALVLAGGLPQVSLIKELKRRKFLVLLADYNKNPVARKYADVYFQVSTLDVDAIMNIAIKEKIDLLITACTDQALLTVAFVSEKLGLPCYIDYKTALNVTNKMYMKDIFNKYNIPTPKHIVLKKFNSNYSKKLNFPIIIKPADCNSSKGVTKVNNKKDFKNAFNTSKNFSRTKTCIVEEFINGTEFSIDVYVDNGKPNILTISEIYKMPIENKFIIYRSKCVSKISKNITKQIENIINKIVKAFNLSNSPLLIQVIVKDNKVYVLEFSARTGGGEKFITIKKMIGVDIIKILVDLTLKKKINIKRKKDKYQYIFSEFLYCNPGIYNRIVGVKKLLKDKVLDNFMIFKPKGTKFESINSSGDRVAGFIINSITNKELIHKHNKVISKLKVIDNNNNDIVRHDLLNTKI